MAKRTYRSAIIAAALLFPGTAGHSEELAAEASAKSAGFESSFARYEALPAAAAPSGNAVDIALIEPASEEIAPGNSLGAGVASYYGRKFHGRRTASGETFDMNGLTAAHRTLPFGSKVRVTNPSNGRSVIVRINDRGPFSRNRTIDLSRAAATEIGLIARGHGTVELALLDD